MYKYTQLKAEITRIILRSLRMNFGVENTKYCWQNLIVPRDARVFTRWSIKPSKMVCMCTEGLGLAVGGACLLLLLLGSSSHVYACHFRGALHAHWVCRVFSGPWD